MVHHVTQHWRGDEPPSCFCATVPAYNALLSRRQLIRAGTSVATAIAIQWFGGRTTASQEAGPMAPTPAQTVNTSSRTGPSDQSFPQPPVLSSG